MKIDKIRASDIREASAFLRAGGRVLLSGTVYTARDSAHLRITEQLNKTEPLPFPLKDAIIYYAGPTPTDDEGKIGSFGPTTSVRMDRFTPRLLDLGLAAMIGKGERSGDVCGAIARNGAVYFCAIGGAGALASKAVKVCVETAYPELGCESVKRLVVEDFPLIVAVDAFGGNLFK